MLKSIKIATSVPDDTFEQAARQAAELGISRSEFFARAARRYLDELAAHSLTSQIDQADVTLPGPVPIPVVFDVSVLVRAVAIGGSPYRSWPSPPPASSNPDADCLGVVNDAAEFALWLSPHILTSTGRVLGDIIGTPEDEIDDYITILAEIAGASGGGLTDLPQVVGDCPDREDNRILGLALTVDAFVIVSGDTDLTAMSPWRGRPIIEPAQFARRVDALRRARRRRR